MFSAEQSVTFKTVRGLPLLREPAVMSTPSSMRNNHPNLDLLRSVAVSLVFGTHLIMALGYLDSQISQMLTLRKLAELGVLIFFIHTSLVLMMSLERLGNSRRVRRFYVRRVFRIYPLAIVIILAAVALEIPPHFEPTYERPSTAALMQNLFLVQNVFGSADIVGPMWSLPLEVQMYLLLPFIFLVARRVDSYFGISVLLLSGFILWYVDSRLERLIEHPRLFLYAPWFFMGVAAYAGYRNVKPDLSAKYFVLSLCIVVSVPPLAQYFIGDYRTGWASWASGIFLALILPYCNEIKGTIVKKCTHAMATYSYGIYLSHVPIMWFSFQQLSSSPVWIQVSAFLLLMFLAPPLLYHLIEAPFIRFGVRASEYLTKERRLTQISGATVSTTSDQGTL